jgi:hypothetical protein
MHIIFFTIPHRLYSLWVRVCGTPIFVVLAALPPSLASASVAPFYTCQIVAVTTVTCHTMAEIFFKIV